VQQILDASSCRPEWLELEITEGVIMREHTPSFQVLQHLKELGIELAIDDFGTGYS
jgi:EAL domain-containing protein (putative c-di-GMP-specific phosphodiesterase class I)